MGIQSQCIMIKVVFQKVAYPSYKITHIQTYIQKCKERLKENSTYFKMLMSKWKNYIYQFLKTFCIFSTLWQMCMKTLSTDIY